MFTILNNTKAATAWLWDFGNGITSVAENPPAFQYTGNSDLLYNVSLTASNGNCLLTVTKPIAVSSNCINFAPSVLESAPEVPHLQTVCDESCKMNEVLKWT